MAGENETLGVGLDTSGAAAGAAQFKRSADDIIGAARGIGRETDGASRQMAASMARSAAAAEAAARAMQTVQATIRASLGLLGAFSLTNLIRESAESAARFETLGVVMGRLAQNTSYSSAEIFTFSQRVQRMGITMTEARSTVISMIQAEMDLANASKLARLAQDAAVIGNTNSSEALSRIIYGIKTAQVEVLRTVGLQVNFEGAYARLADELGKSSAALTEQERVMARTRAAMEAGVTIAGSYEAAMGTASKQMGSMARYADDLRVKIGALFTPAYTSLVFQASDAFKGMNEAMDRAANSGAIASLASGFKVVAENIDLIGAAAAAALGVRLVPLLLRVGTLLAGGPMLAAVSALAALGGSLAYLAAQGSAAERATADLEKQINRISGAGGGVQSAAARQSAEEAEAVRQATQAVRDQEERRKALADSATAAEASFRAQAQATATALDAYLGRLEAVRNAQDRIEEHARTTGSTPDRVRGLIDDTRQRILALQAELQMFADGMSTIEEFRAAFEALDKEMEGSTAWEEYTAGFRRMFEVMERLPEAMRRADQAVRDAQLAATRPNQPPPNLDRSAADLRNALQAAGVKDNLTSNLTLEPQQTARARALEGAARAYADEIERAINYHRELGNATEGNAERERYHAEQVSELTERRVNALRLIASLTAAIAQIGMTEWQQERQRLADMERYARMSPEARSAAEYRDRRLRFYQANPGQLAPGQTAEDAVDNYEMPRFQAGQRATQGRSTQADRVRAEYAQRMVEAEAQGEAAVRRTRAEMERVIAAQEGAVALQRAITRAREEEVLALGRITNEMTAQTREAERQIALAEARLRGPAALEEERQRQAREAATRRAGPGNEGIVAAAVEAQRRGRYGQALEGASERLVASREELQIAEKENELRYRSTEERERTIAAMRVQLQLERDLAAARTPEEAARLREIAAEQTRVAESLAGIRAAQKEAEDFKQSMRDAGTVIANAFENAILAGEKWSNILKSLEQDIARIILRMTVTKPLENAMAQLLGGLGTAVGGSLGGLFNFGSGRTTTAPIVPVQIENLPPLLSSQRHTGGVIGLYDAPHRAVPAALFHDAPRFHTGGGFLAANERPAILQVGERVLTEEQWNSMKSGGGGATIQISVDARGAEMGVEQKIDAVLERRMPALLDAALNKVAAESGRGGRISRSVGRR